MRYLRLGLQAASLNTSEKRVHMLRRTLCVRFSLVLRLGVWNPRRKYRITECGNRPCIKYTRPIVLCRILQSYCILFNNSTNKIRKLLRFCSPVFVDFRIFNNSQIFVKDIIGLYRFLLLIYKQLLQTIHHQYARVEFVEENLGNYYLNMSELESQLYDISLHLLERAMQNYINFEKYSLLICIILGLLGNSLTAIVLFRKKMRSVSSSIYLSVLAICDFVYSIMTLILWFLLMDIYVEGNYLNWFIFFWNILRFSSQFLSVWLIVTFTIERYIVTKYPFLRRSLCTVKRTKITVIMLMGLAILYSILQNFIIFSYDQYTLINIKKINNVYNVFKQLKEFEDQDATINTRRIIESIIIFTIPALMIVICNTLTGYNIYQQNRLRNLIIKASDSAIFYGRTEIISDKMHKIIKMLVLVSSIFVILKLPKHYFMYFFSYLPEYVNTSVVTAIFYLLDTAHYSINFVLYCATGQTFRKELICLFTNVPIRRNRNSIEMDNFK